MTYTSKYKTNSRRDLGDQAEEEGAVEGRVQHVDRGAGSHSSCDDVGVLEAHVSTQHPSVTETATKLLMIMMRMMVIVTALMMLMMMIKKLSLRKI